jgi:subtilase family serine protease
MKMKSFFISVLLIGMVLYGNSQDPSYPPGPAAPQNIIAAEYYVDTDPGIGIATAIPVSPGVNVQNIPASINVTGLTNGVHSLVMRTKSLGGAWGVSWVREFLYAFEPVYTTNPLPQNIVAAEYFIDTDPGFGSGIPIVITAGIDLNNVPVTVNTAALSNGGHRLYLRSKNNQGNWSVVVMTDFIVDFNFAYPASTSLQNIVTAEYFIDTDPGFGSGTAITFTAGLDLNNLPAVINTTGLTNGTHRLFIRSKNNQGNWSFSLVTEFITDADPAYPATAAPAQNIVAAEYFINTDPGTGLGTPISIAAALDISNQAVIVNTSSLAPATTNELYLRTKDNQGNWSITHVKEFAITITNDPGYSSAPAAAQNMVAAEYFINTDPGLGNGTAIPVSAALDINNVAVAVNTSSLPPASTNELYLRTKNNEGSWSITQVKEFLITITSDPAYPPTPAPAQNVVAAEYFINSDPGPGSGTAIPVAAALDINNVAVVVNTSALPPASTNELFLRTKNNQGFWSITNVKEFAIIITNDPLYPDAPAPTQNITAAEYFIDTDPGFGSGTAIPITPATNVSNQAVVVNTTGLTNGQHNLWIRSKGINGLWSVTNSASFITDLISLSTDSLLFGNVPVNTTSNLNVTITNNSSVTQTINTVAVNAPYTTNASGIISIPAGLSHVLQVSYTPTAATTSIEGLQLQTSAGNYNVGLRGTGVIQIPSWTISPAGGYNYGNIPINTSFNVIFNILNTGNVPVTLSNVTSSNPAFTTSFGAGVIPIGGSINFAVLFTPTVVSLYNAQITIVSSTAGVGNVTALVTGNGYNPGAPPVLQFVAAAPYNGTSGVNMAAGQPGDYTYKILYKSSNNRAPQAGSPRVGIDLNGDQDFTDLNEGTFSMIKVGTGTDYVNGEVYTYTFTHNNLTNNAGYRFSALDDNGNTATAINTNYVSGPVITDQQLDLRIFANDITFSKNNPLPGETFTVFARVTNNTALPATNVPVKFFRDTLLIANDVIPAVNAFSSTIISRTLSFAAEGFYPIKVWIDSSNTLGDINPLNNYAIRPVVVGSPTLPGGITVTTSAIVQQCPQVSVSITGHAVYFGTGSVQPVAGAEVTINTGIQLITTTTNSNGDYSYLLTGVTCGGSFTYTVSITDFTFTSSLVTNAIPLPCPAPNACVPAPSMGGATASASGNPCASVVGSSGVVTIHLQYRQRNLANFWNAFDEIIQDTLKVFQDGVLIQTYPSADYSHGPGNEVTIPVNVPLASTTPTVITAELTYVYVEYLQIPSSIYHGNHIPMLHTGGTTISPVAAQPDLTILSYAQLTYTSFSFYDANIKCVTAGAHVVKIYDSIPGGAITLIDTKSIASLAPGALTGIVYNNPAITSGTHIIKVVTDADETVAETNEGNNTFYFTMIVPASELTVTKITTSPTALNTGGTTRFTATIKNTGRSTGSFNVRFGAGGVQLGALKTIAGLGENSTVQVISDPYTVTNASNACGVVVDAFADFSSTVTESNEANNSRSIILGADLSPYQLSSEVGSSAQPAVVRVFTTNQFFPAVRNIGERDVADVTVRFTLAGNWLGADTISSVKAGEIFASHASFTHMFTVAGNYVVKVIADTANTICENDEANNEGDFYITVVESKPDLEVLSQYISPSSLNPNIAQNITLVGTVKNMGGQVSAASVLRFLVDDIQLGADVPINALLPGRDTTVAATAGYSSIIPGVKVMQIVADPLNTMVEEREDNNLATRTMIVGNAPDMSRSFAGAISFNPAGFVSGDSVTVNFSIKNQGPTDGTAWVKFFIKDTTYATTAIDSVSFSLAAGATTIISRRMFFAIDEGFVITEISNCSPIEFDLLNNNDTLHFSTLAKMKQAITISGNLDMKGAAPAQLPEWIGGKIMLGDFDLTVNGIILNYDSAHFIISNGTGKLKLVNSHAENIYPVGPSINSMNFVRLNNTGTPDNFSVRVADYLLLNGSNGDTVLLANVDRTWFIEEGIPGGSNATAEFWWSTTSELPGFDRLQCRTAHYTSLWEYGTLGAGVLAANGQYSRTQTGFTGFSPFTVTSSLFAVPVRLISFTAQNKTNSVLLNWKTENELNMAGYEVERSDDGIHFNSIGSVPAFNTSGSHQYSLADLQPLKGISYYRLKQADLDRSIDYSNIIVINRNSSQNTMTVYPNPVKDRLTIVFASGNIQRKMRIVDAKGAVIKTFIVEAGATSIITDMSAFASGVYIIRFDNGKDEFTQKIIKQ